MAQPVIVHPAGFALDRYFSYVKDSSNRTDRDFLADDQAGKITWEKVPINGFSFGRVIQPIWLKVELSNPGESSRFYITFIYGLVDRIKILIPEKKYFAASGMEIPSESRAVRSSIHYLPFQIDQNEKLTVYIRVDTRFKFFSSSFLLHEKNLFSYYLKNDMPAFVFFGIGLFIVLQSLLHFYNSRKLIHFYFAGYVFFYVIFQIAALAYGHMFLSDNYLLNQIAMHSACEIASIFNVFFIIHLFDLENKLPQIAQAYKIATWFALGGIVFYFTGLEKWTSTYNSIFITILFISYYGIAFYFFKTGISKFFLVAWSMGMAGIFLQALIEYGVAPLSVSYIHLTLYGSIIELVGISWLIATAGTLTAFRKIIPDEIEAPTERPAPVNFNLGEINRRFQALMEVDQMYLDWNLELEDILKKIPVPKSHLAYYLNYCLKTTFRDVLNQFRVQYACSLLSDGSAEAVIKIAHDSGFQSKATFNRVFKDITGLTPQEYREKYTGEIEPGKIS